MSDYCETCEYDWKRRHGDAACPFNSLYWDFFARHRRRLQKNARVAMMYRVWDRMDPVEQKTTLKQAASYRKNLNHL
jgi:deoxyribodipyrimidine photolyase-related protein